MAIVYGTMDSRVGGVKQAMPVDQVEMDHALVKRHETLSIVAQCRLQRGLVELIKLKQAAEKQN